MTSKTSSVAISRDLLLAGTALAALALLAGPARAADMEADAAQGPRAWT